MSFLPSPLGRVLPVTPRVTTVSFTRREVSARFTAAAVRVVAAEAFATLAPRPAMLDPLTDASGTPFTLTFGNPLHVYR